MAVTVTSKGRVTIPNRVRDRLGIRAGSAVDFELGVDARVVLVEVDGAPQASRFEPLRGRAGPGPSTDGIMALTRGEGLFAP